MRHDFEPSLAVPQTASSAQTLRRIADALGVPVSSFGAVDTEGTTLHGPACPDEIALLAQVHSFLKRANPAARDRFVAAIQTMVKLPFA